MDSSSDDDSCVAADEGASPAPMESFRPELQRTHLNLGSDKLQFNSDYSLEYALRPCFASSKEKKKAMAQSRKTHVDLTSTYQPERCTSSLSSKHFSQQRAFQNGPHQDALMRAQSSGNLQPPSYKNHKKELYTSSLVFGCSQTPMNAYKRQEYRRFEGNHQSKPVVMPGANTSNVRFGFDRPQYGTTTRRFFPTPSPTSGVRVESVPTMYASSSAIRFGDRRDADDWGTESRSRYTSLVTKAAPQPLAEGTRMIIQANNVDLKVDGPGFADANSWSTSQRSQFTKRLSPTEQSLADAKSSRMEKKMLLGQSSVRLGQEQQTLQPSTYKSEFQSRHLSTRREAANIDLKTTHFKFGVEKNEWRSAYREQYKSGHMDDAHMQSNKVDVAKNKEQLTKPLIEKLGCDPNSYWQSTTTKFYQPIGHEDMQQLQDGRNEASRSKESLLECHVSLGSPPLKGQAPDKMQSTTNALYLPPTEHTKIERRQKGIVPASSIRFGEHDSGWSSETCTVFKANDGPQIQQQAALCKNLQKTHFVLGQRNHRYRTTSLGSSHYKPVTRRAR